MSDRTIPPLPRSVHAEAARLSGLFAHGRTPTPDVELTARRSLATARLDRELRNLGTLGLGGLDGAQVAHLVGLLLSACGVKYDVATPIERIARDAVEAAQVGESK